MKRLLLAAGAVGAMMMTATPAAAQRYSRGHTSFSITIGNGYGYSPYGYAPYGYAYSPYGYGYPSYGYYSPSYYSNYGGYYGPSYRRHRHHHRYYDRGWWGR